MPNVGPILQNLLSILPASTEMQLFGPAGEPGVQVVVPTAYHEFPDPCMYVCLYQKLHFYSSGARSIHTLETLFPDATPTARGRRGYGVRLGVDVAHRNRVSARWFDVWAGAVAVAAMCTLRGYAGISGLPSELSVTLEAVMGNGMGNGTAGE